MRHTITLLLLLGVSLFNNIHAQDYLYQFDVDTLVSSTCKQGVITKYKNIDVFITENDRFYGEKDTNFCFNVRATSGFPIENMVELDSSMEGRMVFFADTGLNIPFVKDSVLEYIDLSYRRNCRIAQNERWILVESFDTTIGNFIIDTIPLSPYYGHCYCGNKYYRNIKAMIVGAGFYDITENALAGSKATLDFRNDVKVVRDSLRMILRINDSLQIIEDFFDFRDSNLVFSNPDTNKYSNKVHTISVEPIKPVVKRNTLDVTLYSGVFLQPFVEIKGGVFDSLSNTRHKLILRFIDSNLCFQHQLIELVFNGDDEAHFNNTQVSHKSQRSCMMFEQNAKLVVEENGHFEFGTDGNGILAMKPGAKIVLEKNAKISIDGQLALLDYMSWIKGGTIDIHLKEGNELYFGKNATISNRVFENGSVMLNVYLEGGQLDLRHLDAQSRNLINVIDEKEPLQMAPGFENARVYPNPSSGNFNIEFALEEPGEIIWQLSDIRGNQIEMGSLNGKEGFNQIALSFDVHRMGVYHLSFEYNGTWYHEKVMFVF